MQIVANTTGMEAGVTVATDKEARDWCVVVVKGTFRTDEYGRLSLESKQRKFVYVDEHYANPETSSLRYESDFAPVKQMTDIIVVGKAVPPGATPASRVMVRLEVQGRAKDIAVFGERRWVRALGGLVPSPPIPFVEMPLSFDRAFGGIDDSRGETSVAVERRNLAGVGFHRYRTAAAIDGMPLPNLEDPRALITQPGDRPEPIGLGFIGRTWQPRVDYGGTYDQSWRDQVCPLLPADFDDCYFQAAPVDQQFPLFMGGELIRCVHMATKPVVEYRMPALRVPVVFWFADGAQHQQGVLDTVVLEPHEGLAMLTWRTRIALGKKLNTLRGILVGEQPMGEEDGLVGYRDGRPVFAGLGAAVRWLSRR